MKLDYRRRMRRIMPVAYGKDAVSLTTQYRRRMTACPHCRELLYMLLKAKPTLTKEEQICWEVISDIRLGELTKLYNPKSVMDAIATVVGFIVFESNHENAHGKWISDMMIAERLSDPSKCSDTFLSLIAVKAIYDNMIQS